MALAEASDHLRLFRARVVRHSRAPLSRILLDRSLPRCKAKTIDQHP